MDGITDKRLNRIKEYKPSIIGLDRCLKSSVCIPLLNTPEGLSLLFERRSAGIEVQPKDICFPGGMIENGETPKEAVIREVTEELLVGTDQLAILGASDFLYIENLVVYPFVGMLSGYEGTFSADEVGEVFTVPLSFFEKNEPEEYRIDMTICPEENFPYDRIAGGREYQWRERSDNVYFYQYGKYTIWGLTAKITKNFIDRWKCAK